MICIIKVCMAYRSVTDNNEESEKTVSHSLRGYQGAPKRVFLERDRDPNSRGMRKHKLAAKFRQSRSLSCASHTICIISQLLCLFSWNISVEKDIEAITKVVREEVIGGKWRCRIKHSFAFATMSFLPTKSVSRSDRLEYLNLPSILQECSQINESQKWFPVP